MHIIGQSAAKHLMYNKYNKIQFNQEQIDTILNLYKTKSISYIAKLFNRDSSVIKRVLIENNIPIKNISEAHRLPVDETYFDVIDTEDKAYWLGFIYADGYITKTKSSKAFGIKLNVIDIKHLQKFKYCIQSKHKIYQEKIISKYGTTHACAIRIVNSHIVDSLENKGAIYNKSKILLPPTQNQVPKCFIRHFIRGYFDGDGSIYKVRPKRENWKPSAGIQFVGTEKFLDWILQNIKSICKTNAKVYKYNDKDIYGLLIGGNCNVKYIYEYLYTNANVFLDRKRQKFEEIRWMFNDYNSPSERMKV